MLGSILFGISIAFQFWILLAYFGVKDKLEKAIEELNQTPSPKYLDAVWDDEKGDQWFICIGNEGFWLYKNGRRMDSDEGFLKNVKRRF